MLLEVQAVRGQAWWRQDMQMLLRDDEGVTFKESLHYVIVNAEIEARGVRRPGTVNISPPPAQCTAPAQCTSARRPASDSAQRARGRQ